MKLKFLLIKLLKKSLLPIFINFWPRRANKMTLAFHVPVYVYCLFGLGINLMI
jgi:hypothetical protein